MEKLKKLLAGRKFVYYSTTSFMVIAVVGVVMLVYLALLNSEWKLDLTKDGRFAISDDTKVYLTKIDKDVNIMVLRFSGTPFAEYYKNIIDDYEKANPKIKVEDFDPEKNPLMIKKYEIGDKEAVIIVESGNRFRKIDINELYEDYMSQTASLESKLTGAISYVTDSREIKGYFLSGHGEYQLQEIRSVRDRLKDSAMELEELDLSTKDGVPEDATVLVMAGTVTDISKDEKVKIEKYLSNNGKLMVMLSSALDVSASSLKNLGSVLEQYNTGINDDIVFEESQSRAMAGNPTYFIPELEIIDVTMGVTKSKLRVLFPVTRSLKKIGKESKEIILTSIAKTSAESRGETNFKDNPKNDSKDIKGPLDIIFMAEKTVSGENPSTSKVIVYGNNINIVDNEFRQYSANGNVELFVSAIKYLSDNKGTNNITPKTIVEETVTLTTTKALIIVAIVILLPIIFIISGVWVWVVRKRL